MEEIVDIINENDEVIGKATRKEAKSGRFLYRCAGIYVEAGGKLVLEKRSKRKEIRPGNWSFVEETLKSGETYEQAAKRGVMEELGLKIENLQFLGKKIIEDKRYPDSFMLGVFMGAGSGKMKLQKSEVEKAELVSPKQAQGIIKRLKKISPGLEQTFGMYLEAKKW